MAQIVFQILTTAERMGKEIKTGAAQTTIRPGHLIKLDASGSSVSINTVGNAPFGIAFGGRHLQYAPTTQVFGADEPLTAIWSAGEALLSTDFFSGGSLPAAGAALYPAANGLWSTVASGPKIGDCIGTRTATEATGGTGASLNVAHIRFNIQP